jgi:hypothetical protein
MKESPTMSESMTQHSSIEENTEGTGQSGSSEPTEDNKDGNTDKDDEAASGDDSRGELNPQGNPRKHTKYKGGKKQHRIYTTQPKGYRDDENPMNFLHVRLGHISDNYIKKMFKHGMVTFLPNYTYESIKDWNSTPCKWCNLAKLSRIPSLPTGHDIKELKPMEVICTDIIGKLKTLSRRSEHFVVLYVDLRTGYIVTYPIKKKSDVLSTVIKFFRDNVDRYDHKCKKVHSDFDTVYRAENVMRYLQDRGIESTFSAPYHHQAN